MRLVQLCAIALTSFPNIVKKRLRLAAPLILCFIIACWSFPAQAATRISPRLQEQVLQIIRENPEVILESLQAYQQAQQQKLHQAQQAFLQDLKSNPKAVIAESPTTGAKDLKIVLVEFSDFQCPYCAKAQETIKQFMANHQDEVTLVYKHFPLTSIHTEAMPAAKAAWAAAQQGKFWQYQDALFSQQDKLGEALYLEIAQNLNLDMEKFQQDRNIADNAIVQDMLLAENLGITGTPFFVMNGQAFSGAIQLSDMENILARVR
ncbi:thioredoxin domain-containing protein [Planktothrix sp. FACHB-1355]|uniref:Thioredoxin domain-containing protein n=1 Tax=Aerosakkonema funiforme FACHB-1375 TaxID=2949571 RepID=A0A926ZGV2_9CYAN|nr:MULTISPECIES: thioredoxin domain-containing protein [Oscillatoriales]MBD2180216.1 thioredoxin domain-containing protein [Aerosakkonema funiforme FACHB-1375]MBD3563121.1 thioredoxin domain-containing protein [Planktothrix sp. FACHB-1355]